MVEYVGLDVSKEETSFCVVDETGRILAQGKALSDPRSLFEALREPRLCPERSVLETGTLSAWLARGLRAYGLRVDVIDARQAHGVMKLQHNKTDAKDAFLLAQIARSGFCRPLSVGSEAAQKHRILVKARRHPVRQRRETQNAIRGFLGALGLRFAKGSGKLAARVRAALEERPDLRPMIEPLLASAQALKEQIRRLDDAVLAAAKGSPACRLLMSVPGVGPITALAFGGAYPPSGGRRDACPMPSGAKGGHRAAQRSYPEGGRPHEILVLRPTRPATLMAMAADSQESRCASLLDAASRDRP